MMESAIGIWQGQLRTIKHYTEEKLKKKIEIDSVLYSWLVPFCSDIMNKFRVGSDGRTAYEKITEHKCKSVIIGFGESVDYILETNKGSMNKADSRVHQGIFLGYVWRSTECLVGTRDGIFKCRTVKRRPEANAYDPECTEYLKTYYDDYIMKGAKTSPAAGVPRQGAQEADTHVPLRGREFVPRRIYIKPNDSDRHGHTEGCKGCTCLTNRIGPRVLHSEGCRIRMEKIIGEDVADDRSKKLKERFDHCLAQQVAEGDERVESAQDPREDAPEQVPPIHRDLSGDRRDEPEEYNIGSPSREDGGDDLMDQDPDGLDDGPNHASERRLKSPVRAQAVKRKKNIHIEEPATKRSIIDELSEDEPNGMDADSLQAKNEDMRIIGKAMLGQNLHEIYSNARINLAVCRQAVDVDQDCPEERRRHRDLQPRACR